MRIDYAQARTVFELMLARYRTRQYPFDNIEADLPQHLVIPEVIEDPLRHARHLFFACHYMRGTVISSHAFRVLNQLQIEHPWLFTDEILIMTTAADVSAALGEKIPWQKEQVGKLWLENAKTLHKEWGGDPRRIFAGVTKKATLYRRVMGAKYRQYRVISETGKRVRLPTSYTGFGGFQEKMTSMLAYFLEATGHIHPTPLSAPIDFHHFRIYLSTGMIVIDDDRVRYERVKRLGIELAERLQREFKLTQVEYGDIVWLWSLRSCRRSPHNRTEEVAVADGKSTRRPVPVTWASGQVAAYERTCGRCYIADHCQFGIPAGVYYKSGVFLKIERTSPHQALFAATDWPYEVPPKNEEKDNFQTRFTNRAD